MKFKLTSLAFALLVASGAASAEKVDQSVQSISGSSQRSISGSSQRGITGSGMRGITGSGSRGITGSGMRATDESGAQGITGSGSRSITGSSQRSISGSSQRSITGSSQRSISGSSQRGITGSGMRDITGSGMRATDQGETQGITGSGMRSISGSSQRSISGSSQRSISGSSQRSINGSSQRSITGSSQRSITGSSQRSITGSSRRGAEFDVVAYGPITAVGPGVVYILGQGFAVDQAYGAELIGQVVYVGGVNDGKALRAESFQLSGDFAVPGADTVWLAGEVSGVDAVYGTIAIGEILIDVTGAVGVKAAEGDRVTVIGSQPVLGGVVIAESVAELVDQSALASANIDSASLSLAE